MMTAEQLKASILQLAMQGKLVEQRPEEGSGEDLYKDIQREKQRLEKEGRIKNEKPLKQIGEEEYPYDIPDNWVWVRLGHYAEKVTDYVASGSFKSLRENAPSLKTEDYAILVKTADFANYFSRNLTYTTQHGYEFLENSNLFGGELVLSNIGSIGKVFIVPKLNRKMTLAPNSVMIRLTDERLRDYLYHFLLSPQGYTELLAITSGTAMKKFNKTDLKTILIPLPPLEEQKRIVAKIEELMPFVEQYAKASAKLRDLNATFPEMMKSSILQEAIQGKLVPQDPEDEPANVLLEHDQKEKLLSGRRTDIKKKEVQEIYCDKTGKYCEIKNGTKQIIQNKIPFDIPQSWEWIHLGYVCDIARGGSPRPIKKYLTEDPSGINWIKIGDSDIGGKYINSTREKIISEGMSKSRFVHKGDFLLTNSMSFGRPYILNCDGCIHDGWLVLTGYKDVYDKDFLYYMLSSRFAFNQFCDVVSGGVVKNLNSDKVAEALFPVPPLAEQKRIVAKIEELLSFVRKLA